MKLANVNVLPKNLKRWALPAVAATLIGVGVVGCKTQKPQEPEQSFTQKKLEHRLHGYDDIRERFLDSIADPDLFLRIDTNELNDLRTAYYNNFINDSLNFVNRENKTYADTASMLESFEESDKVNAAIDYLKGKYVNAVNYHNSRIAEEAARKDSVRNELEKRL